MNVFSCSEKKSEHEERYSYKLFTFVPFFAIVLQPQCLEYEIDDKLCLAMFLFPLFLSFPGFFHKLVVADNGTTLSLPIIGSNSEGLRVSPVGALA